MLSQLRFPAFDTVTGRLFEPTKRRTYKIAFTVTPICITIGFMKDKKILVDPTLNEMQIMDGFATFVIDQNQQQQQQIYLDATLPGDIDEARNVAFEVSKRWNKVIEESVNKFKSNMYSVGKKSDFVGYVSSKVIVGNSNVKNKYPEFNVWRGDIKESFNLDFFNFENKIENEIVEVKNESEDNWLISSLTK